jgi:8-oxo-dGTP diphosphatase
MRQSVRAIVIKDNSLLAMKRNKFGKQYYTLIGGGVDVGEALEVALRRELQEETGMQVGTIRPVFTEDDGNLYGVQYVYLCEYIGGEPTLGAASEESAISKLGQNMYEPVWLSLAELPDAPFRSESVKQAILEGVRSGFPPEPQTLAWQAEPVA